eukprot:scaffold1128_cov19-Tisochrysis_lutea.AAC.1
MSSHWSSIRSLHSRDVLRNLSFDQRALCRPRPRGASALYARYRPRRASCARARSLNSSHSSSTRSLQPLVRPD